MHVLAQLASTITPIITLLNFGRWHSTTAAPSKLLLFCLHIAVQQPWHCWHQGNPSKLIIIFLAASTAHTAVQQQ
jgi:hypothetical protein